MVYLLDRFISVKKSSKNFFGKKTHLCLKVRNFEVKKEPIFIRKGVHIKVLKTIFLNLLKVN